MQGALKVLLYVLAGLGIFGVIGTIILAFRDTNTGVERPDMRLTDLLEEVAVEGKLSVMISRNNYLIYEYHTPEGIDGDSAYPIGSLGALFTATAVQHLHDEAKLDLDTRIGNYLPDLPQALQELTPVQLLTHTSGLTPGVDLDNPGVISPGRASRYAAANETLLEQLVETVSGTSVLEYTKASAVASLARSTDFNPELDLSVSSINRVADEEGIDQWSISPGDLKRWEQAMNTNLLTKMKTHQRAITPAPLADGGRGDYGFGWRIDEWRGLRRERWTAREDDLGALVMRHSEKTFGLVIFTDIPPEKLDLLDLSQKISDLYLAREFPKPMIGPPMYTRDIATGED